MPAMRRLAAPTIGGLLVSFVMELALYPVVFHTAKSWLHRREFGNNRPPEGVSSGGAIV